MLERAAGVRADVGEGRFVVETRHLGSRWEVIVEPDAADSLLVIITAYPVSAE